MFSNNCLLPATSEVKMFRRKNDYYPRTNS